jgi:hypothetical protein
MPLAENVKVIQNFKDTSLEKSFLKKALQLDFHLSIFDVDSCRTFTELIVANSTPQQVLGTRLRIKDDKITEINIIVIGKDDWFFNAKNYLDYSKSQNWYVLSENERSTREFLIDAGNQYCDLFKGDTVDIPWGAPCYRIEGGMITLKSDTTADYCYTSPKDLLGKADLSKRDFIVDVDLGTVNVYCMFGNMPDSHMFRLVNKHYRYVHTLTVGK